MSPHHLGSRNSFQHWPENARRIVALLNIFQDWPVELIEQLREIKPSPMMAIPPEVHVEFADDLASRGLKAG